MQTRTYTLLLGALLVSLCTLAQEKTPYKFGKLSAADFDASRYKADTGTSAVIVADVGSSSFESGTNFFVQQFKCYRRVHILNKNGYDEADVVIGLYQQGSDEERLSNLKAVTYNLENGKVVESKLETKNVFTDKLDKNRMLKKFTLPNVREGSIIEYSYTITSDFFQYLRPWSFQDLDHPVLWSEYEVSLPEYYEYIFLSQGYNNYYIKDSKNTNKTFGFSMDNGGGRSQYVSVTPGVTEHRWVMKDVLPLKKESFVTSLDNHRSSIEFQLANIRFPESPVKQIMSTWPKFMETMLKDEDFGAKLDKANGFMEDKVKELSAAGSTPVEKAETIYNWVRDNFTCTDTRAVYTEQSLRTTFSKKSGSVSEINLLLVAMLRQAGLEAAPVLMATRDAKKVYELYPIRSRFNYTTALVTIDGKNYDMDATRPYLGFGKLHADCYNGHARKVTLEAMALDYSADSLREQKVTGIFLSPNGKGGLDGHFQQQPTYFESYDLRSRVREKGEEELFKERAKSFTTDIQLRNAKIEHLKDYKEPVTLDYDFTMNLGDDGDIVYLQPMFSESMRTNPFKSADRRYPVEMLAVPDFNYTLSLQLPEGYQVDELPKSMIVKYNDGEGIFQYLVQESGGMIQLRSRLQLSRAMYEPEEYQSLRDFYDVVVKKHAEQIVLKKKS
ncbi:transglutaminase domain-containing protein [Chitinophaga lutea]